MCGSAPAPPAAPWNAPPAIPTAAPAIAPDTVASTSAADGGGSLIQPAGALAASTPDLWRVHEAIKDHEPAGATPASESDEAATADAGA